MAIRNSRCFTAGSVPKGEPRLAWIASGRCTGGRGPAHTMQPGGLTLTYCGNNTGVDTQNHTTHTVTHARAFTKEETFPFHESPHKHKNAPRKPYRYRGRGPAGLGEEISIIIIHQGVTIFALLLPYKYVLICWCWWRFTHSLARPNSHRTRDRAAQHLGRKGDRFSSLYFSARFTLNFLPLCARQRRWCWL